MKCRPIIKRHKLTGCHDNKCHKGKVSLPALSFRTISKNTFITFTFHFHFFFYCHITTAQVPWWVKFLWACSRQCRKTTDNLHMDRQCKKNSKQFTYGQTVQKNNKQFTYGQTVQKKQQLQFTYGQTVQKNNSNLHMDSTYLQTVQKTMCKIHIHILSTLSVL